MSRLNVELAGRMEAACGEEGAASSLRDAGGSCSRRFGIPAVLLVALAGCQSSLLRTNSVPPVAHSALPTTHSALPTAHSAASATFAAAAPIQPRWGDEDQGADGVARVSVNNGSRAMPSEFQQAGDQTAAAPGAALTASPNTSPNARHSTLSHRDPLVRAVSFSQAEPRSDFAEDGTPLGIPDGSWILGSQPEQFPDEYLLDGGDRGLPVHDESHFRKGLETEDTVAEYVDHTGKKHQKATNSVAIYAPRFASVRTVSSPSGDTAIERLAGVQELRRDSGVKNRVGPDQYAKTDQLRGVGTRSRASGVANREFQSGTFSVARLASGTKLQNLFQDFSYARAGRLDQSDEARLALGIDAAASWSREQNPVILATLDSLHQVEAKFKPAELKMAEDLRKEPGRLQIVKLADHSTAKPGDVVTFMVRYDNLGERELTDVRIIDNLTPRLDYIADSATSDRPGEINVQDNEEGSLVLIFQLDDPLPGKTGGVITFECRVR